MSSITSGFRRNGPGEAAIDSTPHKTQQDDSDIQEPFEVQILRHEKGGSQTEIEIVSPGLIAILKEACMDYPGTEYQVLCSSRVRFRAPFMMLFYNIEKIKEMSATLKGPEKRPLLKLLDFMKHLNSWAKSQGEQTFRVIAFDDLWLLYRPGNTVYQRPLKHGDGWRALKIGSACYQDASEDEDRRLRILYHSLAFDSTGRMLVPVTHVLILGPYVGERFITDLELIPRHWIPNDQIQSLRNTLERRGRKYWSFNGDAFYQDYSGNAWRTFPKPENLKVIIDYATGSKYVPTTPVEDDRLLSPKDRCSCSSCCRKYAALPSYASDTSTTARSCPRDVYPTFEPSFAHDEEEQEPRNPFLFCPSHVEAFSLRYKSWKRVEITALSNIQRSIQPMESLVLADQSKFLLGNRVENSLKLQSVIQPEIASQGLTVVLKGPTGSGKTMTAMAIAEAKARPLYVLSWPEISGTHFGDFEKRVREIFYDAENWGAILVIEDADALMQRATNSDPQFEIYSSTMLRKLEQHRGVVCLTISRADLQVSEAMRSKLSISITLPPLNVEARAKIWSNLVKDVTNPDDSEALADLTTFVSTYDLNGHQLHNCLRTTIALSKRGYKPIQRNHIDLTLSHDAEFIASGSLLQQRDFHKRLITSAFSRQNERNSTSTSWPSGISQLDYGKSVHFDTRPGPSPQASPASSFLTSPAISVTASPIPLFPAVTAPTSPLLLSVPEQTSPQISPPPTPAASNDSLSPLRTSKASRGSRASRPGILRRHTTQGSLDPPASEVVPVEGWTWKMLPAHVRRPQLQFEKGLPDTDDEGVKVGRRKEREREERKEGGNVQEVLS